MAAKVYLARLSDGAGPKAQARAFTRAVEAAGFAGRIKKRDMVAIKVHVGERSNVTHVRPELAAAAAKMIKDAGGAPFITDTSTLYRGRRENGIRHALHAHAHGFSIENTGAPFIPLDGLSGTHEREAKIKGEIYKSVKVAGDVFLADGLLVLSHATGHMGTGIGAAIKNVGMGLASRAGKMRQHSSMHPRVRPEDCVNCGKCRRWCPEEAISEREGVSFIVLEECIGCGECIAVCRYGAIEYDFKVESKLLQKKMAEHAAGALQHFGKKAVFVNVLVDMTRECDCLNKKQKKAVPDLGILASTDIVAVDQATLELTVQESGKNLAQLSFPHLDPAVQITHAEKMGMGKRKYRLVEV